MQAHFQQIIDALPYSEPFLFVNTLHSVSENGAEGSYTFSKDSYFYEGHFKNNPVTPGVILTECMAQIGVVCLGIYLTQKNTSEKAQLALSSTQVDFYKAVFPEETVRVVSEKEYFRFNKLKCKVTMYNEANEIVCKGNISGMVKL
ncbi:3-hydroxyacyl-ACP dehydratase FabZ family protein [Ulvibacter litoralis]|uniref:3-hydroxyacyl-[acyl-carrier-protein] dehydratase n=1 Tax=Ulvibacter litoralis TaxID=227084 RepID=A0A1G7FNL6_9FLAO|nr:beta-hydroxyacyl-ACP dehydratase [Ulvibacter litoralis]GHC50409.1 beta-hydroxyacyl-ACP dehydratase [Ulvibacter litoralis]SDE77473.1 3-hydroxyacyl-[acyl-carrier-protein] dehydratase [Ulvibacter litoralis]